MPLIAIIGGLTALFAATIGLVQKDIKKVLAYSTVSQLGFMFVAVGCGAYSIAVFHLMTHAFFKAQLFLGSGSVIHALEHGYGHGNPQSQDMTLMGGMKAKMPITCWTMVLGGLALAGIPLFSGFFSKDEILLMAFDYHGDYKVFFTVAYAMCVLAAACTAFYTARLLAMTFFGTFRGDKKVWDHLHESPLTMTIPLMVLAALAVVGGYINLPHNIAHGLDHFVQFLNGSTFRPAIAAAEAHEHGMGTMWMNMILSSVIAIGMFWFGFTFYKSEGGLEKARARAEGGMKGIYNLLYNKYWVDEIYEKLIIRPIRVSSQALLIGVDMLLIDLVIVSGPAYVVALLSHVFRRIQSGLVSHYVMLMTGGVIVILLWVLL
jgi:NADH-quinone oxidoreductase subunit L